MGLALEQQIVQHRGAKHPWHFWVFFHHAVRGHAHKAHGWTRGALHTSKLKPAKVQRRF